MHRLGVHKRWGLAFLRKEIETRVVFAPDRLEEKTRFERKNVEYIESYAFGHGGGAIAASFPSDLRGLRLSRVGEHRIYIGATTDPRLVWLGQHFRLRCVQFGLYRLLSQIRTGVDVNPSTSTLQASMEAMVAAYALGWCRAADIIGSSALHVIPYGAMYDANPTSQYTQALYRRCFARFALKLYGDYADKQMPGAMPKHPFACPAYDQMLACWRDPDPEALVPALLAVCDWHTHECMYPRSDRPERHVDFADDTLMGWPLEVHMIFRLRERLGLAVPQPIDHPLIRAPLGPYLPPQPVVTDRLLSDFTAKLIEDFPDFAVMLGETARADVMLEDVPL